MAVADMAAPHSGCAGKSGSPRSSPATWSCPRCHSWPGLSGPCGPGDRRDRGEEPGFFGQRHRKRVLPHRHFPSGRGRPGRGHLERRAGQAGEARAVSAACCPARRASGSTARRWRRNPRRSRSAPGPRYRHVRRGGGSRSHRSGPTSTRRHHHDTGIGVASTGVQAPPRAASARSITARRG